LHTLPTQTRPLGQSASVVQQTGAQAAVSFDQEPSLQVAVTCSPEAPQSKGHLSEQSPHSLPASGTFGGQPSVMQVVGISTHAPFSHS
jgi:hypothetical protein